MTATKQQFISIPFVTIDSATTLDIDDAIHVSKTDSGYTIMIAIANPAKQVQIDSTEDRQARLAGATAYIRDKAVRRMLPVHISEDQASLNAGKARNALILEINLSADLETQSIQIHADKIQVAHKISYDQITKILSDTEHPAREMLALSANIAKALLQSRRNHGAMALFDMARLIMTDEEGNIRQLKSPEETIGNIIVQEMMILANTLVARYMIENDIPGVYRNHQPKNAAPSAESLVETLEGWLNSKNYDEETVKEQFKAIAGKASYASTVTGHYGLNLPYYLHMTSPLRRYADLANSRQILAFLNKEEFPYSLEELRVMSNDLNEAIERRKLERSEGFKVTVQKTANRAIENGDLKRLAEHELSQAIKLSSQAGEMPEILAEELMRRMDMDILSDKAADVLMTDIERSLINEQLASKFASWLARNSSKAMHLLQHASSIEFVKDWKAITSGELTSFTTKASLVDKEGNHHEATADGSKKKDAEKLAAIKLVCSLMQLPVDDVDNSTQHKAHTQNINHKGELLELCQKFRWPTPIFESSGRGPSHSMNFEASAYIEINGKRYSAGSSNAGTKKEAESIAAKGLLKELRQIAPKSDKKSEPSQNISSNPVGYIQELAQKNKYALPEYAMNQITIDPPEFECKLTINFGIKQVFIGLSNNKQGAKTAAATEAVKSIKKA